MAKKLTCLVSDNTAINTSRQSRRRDSFLIGYFISDGLDSAATRRARWWRRCSLIEARCLSLKGICNLSCAAAVKRDGRPVVYSIIYSPCGNLADET